MLDIKFIRQNPEVIKDSIKKRGLAVDIDRLLELDKKRIPLIQEIDQLRSQKKSSQKPTSQEIKALQKVKSELEKKEKEFEKVDLKYQEILWDVPNLLSPDTPVGKDESENVEIKKWGKPSKFDFQPKDHLALAQDLNLVDFERGAKTSGNKFYFLKNEAVQLVFALHQFILENLSAKKYTPMLVPHLVNERIAKGTGFLPRGEEKQIYKVEGEDLNLIATAEMSLAGFHMDEILAQNNLPLRYLGFSSCYRVEAGAYGKHSKGLFRVHQFDKWELYIYTLPEDSERALQELVEISEDLLKKLEIPYRVTQICSGDFNAPAYKKFDLEYWSPKDKEYREIGSASNCTDFQARRLKTRYKDNKGDILYPYTLNNTALPVSRALVAILENYQTYDGSVIIPKVLQKYMGLKIIKR